MALEEGTSKYNTGKKSITDLSAKQKHVELGEVISIDDSQGLGRIQVRIKGPQSNGGDDGVLDADLPWAFPMLPKTFSVQPQVGEAVFIFVFSQQQSNVDRLYFGPIISQPQQLPFDPFYVTAMNGFSFASQDPAPSVDTIPELIGVFPDPTDVSIQGRNNTDITVGDDIVLIRAGKFVTTTPSIANPFYIKFNSETQAYIQIKNNVVIESATDSSDEETGTVTNIVANKINLLTHEYGSPRFNLTDQTDLITDDELTNILENAHQLPFGDIMIEWMKLCRDAILEHVHNGNGNPATDLTISGNKQAVATFKKNTDKLMAQMLSQNIRIN